MSRSVKILKSIINQIRFRSELKRIDEIWYFMGGSCFGMFSPSFYYTHTKKEIERITAEEVEKMQNMIVNLQCQKQSWY